MINLSLARAVARHKRFLWPCSCCSVANLTGHLGTAATNRSWPSSYCNAPILSGHLQKKQGHLHTAALQIFLAICIIAPPQMFLALCNAVRLQRHEQFSGHLRTAVLQILLAICVLQRHKSHWPYASCSATTAPGHLRFQCHKQLAGRLHIAVPQISLAMCVLQRHKSFWPSAYRSAISTKSLWPSA